ncbi:Protein of unknown function [Natronorubrum sediminis]|uniref:UPF0391 membrane protein SAMN04487967_0963 n=1 Tax=Natronorubrum sediminis TaxID=640943 RepID=A0A1H6FSE3_9EURY|nr:DUF1328 family protein [Natronorubrum sediminis]SEH12783.1 Protein of unknown function [Natronorubrum sediminis]
MLEIVPTIPLHVTDVALQVGGGDFLYWALIFFVLAVVAAAVGARGVAGISMEIARIFVLVFIILAVVALLL